MWKHVTSVLAGMLCLPLGILAQTPPENDKCRTAAKLQPHPLLESSNETRVVTLQGSTTDSANDFVPWLPPCDSGSSEPGVWYFFQGTGEAIELSGCSHSGTSDESEYYFYFTAFTGPSACDVESLQCATGRFARPCNKPHHGGPFLDATIPMKTEANQTYYIWVHHGSLVGEFELSIREIALPSNNDCENAIPLDSSSNELTLGSTMTATPDNVSFCVDTDAVFGTTGVWYSIDAKDTENEFKVSTCHRNITDYHAIVSVYAGQDCDALECIGGQEWDESCNVGPYATAYSWNVTSGQRKYYLVVHGWERGNFGLSLEAKSSAAPTVSLHLPLAALALLVCLGVPPLFFL